VRATVAWTDAGGNGGAIEVKLGKKKISFRRGNGEVETVFTVAKQSRAGLTAAWEPTQDSGRASCTVTYPTPRSYRGGR